MDSPWGHTMRFRYGLALTLVVGTLLVAYVSFRLYAPPTCFDAKQNGDETGVDCGGKCLAVCTQNTPPLSVAWALPFKVSEGKWHLLAYVENPNEKLFSRSIAYKFEWYDKFGTYRGEKKGTTYALRQSIIPIFEGNIEAEDIARVVFTLDKTPAWEQVPYPQEVRVSGVRTEHSEQGGEAVRGDMHNEMPETIRNVSAVAVVYGADKNAMAVSKTFIPEIRGYNSAPFMFVWPERFSQEVGRVEVFPLLEERS
jgi:hypothetical protein